MSKNALLNIAKIAVICIGTPIVVIAWASFAVSVVSIYAWKPFDYACEWLSSKQRSHT